MVVYAWCSHCFNICRMALKHDFIWCSSCGKVLGEVSVKTASKIKKNSRFKGTKRVAKRRCNALIGV